MALRVAEIVRTAEKNELKLLLRDMGATRLEILPNDSGLSPWYAGAKHGYGSWRARELMCNLFCYEIPEEATCIVTGGYGGYLAPLIGDRLHLEMAMVKDKERSHHGEDALFDGIPPAKGDMVVVFDDVLASGGGALRMKEAAEKRGAKVIKFLFVQSRNSNPNLGRVPEYHIFDSKDFPE